MKIKCEPQNGRAKTAGRPRRLTTEQVLETAIAIGLEGLTMSAVARRLGVSITVLYGYVSSREELVRLAASYALEQHQYQYPKTMASTGPFTWRNMRSFWRVCSLAPGS